MMPAEEPQYTTDDLLAIMYAHNGYLIVASNVALEIGFIPKWNSKINAKIPVRIVAESSYAEYIKQHNSGVEALFPPGYEAFPLPDGYRYYYRVEAVD